VTDGIAGPRVGFCREAARKVLREHSVAGAPTPVEEIVARSGFEVLERDWPQGTSGILLRERRVIGVNRNHAPVRRRFSLAHEFGHYVLAHHLWFDAMGDVTIDNPPREGCEGPDKTPEREADLFAAELLVPLAYLKREVRRGRPVSELANLFRVSEPTMFIALQEHRLLNRL